MMPALLLAAALTATAPECNPPAKHVAILAASGWPVIWKSADSASPLSA